MGNSPWFFVLVLRNLACSNKIAHQCTSLLSEEQDSVISARILRLKRNIAIKSERTRGYALLLLLTASHALEKYIVKLENIVPWGRSFEEYKEIFSLTEADLKKSILGCGDGPASFNAELSSQGGKVVSVDPIYRFNTRQLKNRISDVYDEVMPQMHLNKDKYIWDNIPSVEELGKIRMSAMDKFLADYESGKQGGRYVDASLPNLDFKDKQFDIALCSHFLFLYSAQVSLGEHIKSLVELCRVAKEVRVYPLIALNGEVSPHLNKVISELNLLNISTSLANVKYQFQKSATQMLVVKSV